jgi:3-oxoacyl-[acyl-carrier-protein] synthase II
MADKQLIMEEKRVVITGLGVVTALGSDLQTFWGNLLAGKSGISRITRWDPSAFDCQIAAEIKDFDPTKFVSPKEVRRTDRYTQFCVAAGKLAVTDSGLDLMRENRERIGVIIGSGIGGIETLETQHDILRDKGPGRMSPFTIPMLIANMGSGYVSMELGLRGPNWAPVSACATATHAMGEAWKSIHYGEADVMLGGGSEAAITRLGIGAFCAMRAMSVRNNEPERASRPFDAQRDGFVMGEGSAVVVMEELEHAKKRGARIYCEVLGYAATADAHHMTAPAPEGEGAARCMALALKSARMNPEEISYINAHGTSTELNDKFETQAIKKVFGAHAKKVAISSTKSMTGHLLGAAGSVEMVVCAKAMEANIVPPTINYENPDPECDLDYTPNKPREMKVDAVLNNSFGFGGHNAAIIARKLA